MMRMNKFLFPSLPKLKRAVNRRKTPKPSLTSFHPYIDCEIFDIDDMEFDICDY